MPKTMYWQITSEATTPATSWTGRSRLNQRQPSRKSPLQVLLPVPAPGWPGPGARPGGATAPSVEAGGAEGAPSAGPGPRALVAEVQVPWAGAPSVGARAAGASAPGAARLPRAPPEPPPATAAAGLGRLARTSTAERKKDTASTTKGTRWARANNAPPTPGPTNCSPELATTCSRALALGSCSRPTTAGT